VIDGHMNWTAHTAREAMRRCPVHVAVTGPPYDSDDADHHQDDAIKIALISKIALKAAKYHPNRACLHSLKTLGWVPPTRSD
jgi:hypothetical protein